MIRFITGVLIGLMAVIAGLACGAFVIGTIETMIKLCN